MIQYATQLEHSYVRNFQYFVQTADYRECHRDHRHDNFHHYRNLVALHNEIIIVDVVQLASLPVVVIDLTIQSLLCVRNFVHLCFLHVVKLPHILVHQLAMVNELVIHDRGDFPHCCHPQRIFVVK